MNCVDFVERELRQPVRTKSGLVGRIHRHRHPPLRRSEPIVRFDDSCPITELLLVESSKGVVESGRGTKEKQIRFCNILEHFGTDAGLVVARSVFDCFAFSSRQGLVLVNKQRRCGDGPPKRVERSLQSLRMPIDRHFWRRQYWQRLRWCLVTSQSLLPRHV